LLRDRCLQLFNFANFAVERGGALGRRTGRTMPRCATTSRSRRDTLVRANIPTKLVGRKIQSNFNNAAANRLEVVEDTTDVAG
jgi:hypothetical protein